MSGELTKVDVNVVGLFDADNLTISIYAGSVEGDDLGTEALGVVSFAVPTTGGESQVTSVEFTGINIESGKKYSIKYSGATTSSNLFLMGEFPSNYSRGTYSTTFPDETVDLYFATYVRLATGIVSKSEAFNPLVAYPNPVINGVINFDIEQTNVQLINTTGEIVLSNATTKQLNVSNIEKGVYSLKTDLGISKIVIQ